MALLGYTCVSTVHQDDQPQGDALPKAGVFSEHIYSDVVSGSEDVRTRRGMMKLGSAQGLCGRRTRLWCGVSTGSVALFWMFALPSRMFRARGIKVKFGASDFVAFDTDSYSRSPSRAMRTARSQTSGGYFFGKIESFHQKGNDIKPGTVRGGRFSSLCAPPLF